jgi:hypothetical protein
MGDLEIKLKIGSHYQTLSLELLYKQWKTDGLRTYSFSKSQLTRIKKHFEDFASQLNPPQNKNTSTQACDFPVTETQTNSSIEQCDEYKELNLDVYIENDFEFPTYTQLHHANQYQERLNYYQELLTAVQEIRSKT